MDEIECVVIGAGVVGLAVARALAARGREVIVLEAADAIGTGTSSRNSEVIHAGLYYPRGSLKATLCVRGRELLYEFCASHNVPHRRCGKLLVATARDQIPQLESILTRGRENGVFDLTRISAAEAQALEPALECVEAVYSPQTGIVDSHQLMLALQGDAERDGAVVALQSPVESIDAGNGYFVVHVGGAAPTDIRASCVINSAGLYANALARRVRGLDVRHVPPLFLARGSYFSVSGRAPFSRLIYPMPSEAGLGVHLTIDLGGQARFGPDVEWVDTIGYDVDPHRADSFYAQIRRYWPGLPDHALQPAYSGIRPKLSGPGEPAADFMIQGAAAHGVRGLVNLFGIESPGLTASLAIAQRVCEVAGHA
ncbi:NAD(P)/FAD-dependent oxidoreductase [Paraburkholderia caballeronis]|uniref:L-2-hydroxyglutarate oxidase LhgO n=1 Tax=Paraburkholderia caballeronis TaxID=416943 RepID=A0A1H7HHM2_9BURK|nr:NAD(P)/FAD-dependent oxidoreductase [Paraburkholderia caballeronis]PXW29499.1 L-2-hydroxyglutarate oxidase LhgO [Paraburkholderia caballeronis]PXX04758.1 L-2-hydroxyglutarate oxidase LhgO [Paraburkholderia caballeronis]RAK05819.1 L-2-hydroxyglutarate oxidase LhgO [Paraburkholderia caballeronis]SEB41346.1 L-2-hydroxyglutarate oxidase LhgO [Paraburkholderia caballeronis]SEK49779.1 L-2-hydroxyglutarate oxidase LhgO [Paraburkholderia caballeronis]